ncbi:MAG: alanine dehydrogenase [Actinomycetota bacterium]|nr:alanine dehydrogenase [Actinomycetota bacterium]
MRVGVPREVMESEFRVAITPAGVREFVEHGHSVLVEKSAGHGSSIPDEAYEKAGATIEPDGPSVWKAADMILKVKEPLAQEFPLMRAGQILFTYLHLAAHKDVTEALMAAGTTAIAYETVELPDGRLPLLAPMSEIAGRMAPHVAAHFLERPQGGRGVLLSGVSGVHPARVVVLGAGFAGMNAAWIAQGMEAEVVLIDKKVERLRYVDHIHKGRILTLASSVLTIEEQVVNADVVVGAVLVAGAKAPVLVREETVAAMRPGAVLVDISIDQGGCFETSRVTTHTSPTYVTDKVVHYCVGNMPGGVPHTSTYALTNATMPYALVLARKGLTEALAQDQSLARGVNVHEGNVTNQPVAEALGLPHVSLTKTLRGTA